jgi:alpha-glucosidase
MADFGYDVADYCNVDPLFGSLDDFQELLDDVHRRGMRMLIDLVPNHTSDAHPWFEASRQSKDNPYATWYVWKDAHPNSPPHTPLPPNNWRDALTGGSAWQWDEQRQQFYLHSFTVGQPDLNWNNPEVREAIKAVMRFWLDKGVDGFRVDAVYWIAKDPLLRDDSANVFYRQAKDHPYDALIHDNSQGWPGVYTYLAEIASVLEEEPYVARKRFMVTEAYPSRHQPLEAYMAFYTDIDPQVAAPFNFEGLFLPWKAQPWRQFLQDFHHALQDSPYGVASYAFGNHDKPRLASRLGNAQARAAAVLQLSLPGMIYVYYGEEIGMKQGSITPSQARDPAAQSAAPWLEGRDPQRTPMQWTSGKHAGFSDAPTTWLPVSADFEQYNVEQETQDPHSFLALYRILGTLRNSSSALRYGNIDIVDIGQPDVLAYTRVYGDEHCLTLVNFSNTSITCWPACPIGELLVSSEPQTKLANVSEGKIELLPHEAALFLQ